MEELSVCNIMIITNGVLLHRKYTPQTNLALKGMFSIERPYREYVYRSRHG